MTKQTQTPEPVGYFCDHSDEPYGARTHYDWEWDEVNGGHTFQHSPNTISAHTGVDRGYLKPEDAERRCPRALPVYAVDVPALLARIAELEAERHTTNEALDDAVNAIRAKDQRIAELEKAACRCFPAEMHDAGCSQSLVVVDGVEYSAVHWYRDAEGAWWLPLGGDPMRMVSAEGVESVPLSEVVADYGPLTRSEFTSGDQPETQCTRVIDWGRCQQPWGHLGPHLYPTVATEAVSQ